METKKIEKVRENGKKSYAGNPDWGGINAKRVWEYIQGLKGEDLLKLLDVK